MLPQQFKANYLTQQMAMKIGRQLSRNEYYFAGLEDKVRKLLVEPIEKESGRGFADVLCYVKSLDIVEFVNKCKPFAK
jgi:hypothetical protein